MKLLTEMQDRMNGNGKHPVFNDPGMRPERAFAHDVSAGHALMQAIAGAIDSNSSRARADALFAKADEIMHEWGFEPEAGKC